MDRIGFNKTYQEEKTWKHEFPAIIINTFFCNFMKFVLTFVNCKNKSRSEGDWNIQICAGTATLEKPSYETKIEEKVALSMNKASSNSSFVYMLWSRSIRSVS